MATPPIEAAPAQPAAPFQPGPRLDDPLAGQQRVHQPADENALSRHQHHEPAPEPPAVSPEDEQRQRDARYRNSRGAQVILDPDSDASLGARGGAADTIEGNTLVRDRHLLSHHIDPRDPDASHLPGNVVPAGGEVSDKIGDKHEARFRPVVDKSA